MRRGAAQQRRTRRAARSRGLERARTWDRRGPSDNSSTAGGAGRPSLSAATQRLAAALDEAAHALLDGCQDSSVKGTVTPPGALSARSRSSAAGRSDRQATGTRAHRAGPSTSIVPRQVVARASHPCTRGSMPASSSCRATPRSGGRRARRRPERKSPRAPRASAGRCAPASARASGA